MPQVTIDLDEVTYRLYEDIAKDDNVPLAKWLSLVLKAITQSHLKLYSEQGMDGLRKSATEMQSTEFYQATQPRFDELLKGA